MIDRHKLLRFGEIADRPLALATRITFSSCKRRFRFGSSHSACSAVAAFLRPLVANWRRLNARPRLPSASLSISPPMQTTNLSDELARVMAAYVSRP